MELVPLGSQEESEGCVADGARPKRKGFSEVLVGLKMPKASLVPFCFILVLR